ncbi:hypothetical protein AMATHDRAFT_9069 [Amanita thiersii Skay4041]|uniref:THO1-MOS11 C-terminal domain-containing protein n=1 Tax=Amanita thiersii Skay4041 TaxID=703135 RepID=A0A2A9N7L7_9AGAR|nr:hypothetical protein AMATHDRAFT_9069 [Amanita thiersii Skay4041]
MLPQSKLKSLKVVDLRNILSNASLNTPSRATKADLIARILDSSAALQAFYALYPSSSSQSPLESQSASTLPPDTFSSVREPIANSDITTLSDPDQADTSGAPASPTTATPTENDIVAHSDETEMDKHKRRAERFGTHITTTPDSQLADPELEKRKKRAERFGVPLIDSFKTLSANTEHGRRPSAKQSLGSTSRVTDDSEKLKARSERFGTNFNGSASRKRPAPESIDTEELEKRRRRAERFGTKLIPSR